MRDSWLKLVRSVLRPVRPDLARCLRERDRYIESRAAAAKTRTRAIASCEARIEAARAEVFAAQTGVVTKRMTELEREWRLLSRPDRDAGMMDLWAIIAPPAWIDRKRWRGSAPAAWLDAAVALASDVEGVEAAERGALALREGLTASGHRVGACVRWRLLAGDLDASALLEAAATEARAAVSLRDGAHAVLDRVRALADEVTAAAMERVPERPSLASAIGAAAEADALWTAARLDASANVAAAFQRVWAAGYSVSAIDESGITLELPPLF